MIKIIDTFAQINDLFEDGKFILDKWKTYMNSIYDNAAKLVIDDMKDCLDSGDYVYEKILGNHAVIICDVGVILRCDIRNYDIS